MEITEKWIGECAGGRVFREARSLVKRGRVNQLKVQDGVFQARVGQGEKPLRVTVKVLGPTEVKNHCPCTMSRRTGAMCEHAAAVLMASVMQPRENPETVPHDEVVSKSEKQVPVPEAVPLDVQLSPRFPEEGLRNVHLKRSARSADALGQADFALALWLQKHTGQTSATMLSLPDAQVASFYQAVVGHPGVRRAKDPVAINLGPLCPRLEMELDGEHNGEMVWVRVADGESFYVLGDRLAWWDVEEGRLVVDQGGGKVGQDLSRAGVAVVDLAGGDWLHLETAKLVRVLDDLDQCYQLPDGLGGLEIHEIEPEIELQIAGSTRALQARLTAIYPGDVRVPLGEPHPHVSGFPISGEDEHIWLLRHPEFEQLAIARLMEDGFQPLDASGMLFLRGEDETVDFLTASLPSLREQWCVETEEKLVHLESRLGRIEPRIEVQGSGTDWLACDVSWQCGGETLDRDSVRRLLSSGSRTMKLPRGGKAVISQFDAEIMDGFLLDTDPRQDDGVYYLPQNQSAYLAQLRRHYGQSGAGEDSRDVTVPALPEKLGGILRDYQKEGVDWLYRRAAGGGAALLADDMGLGKTLQTLAFLRLWKEGNSGPALVVCPATLLGNWRDEAAKFVPDMNVLVMHGTRRKEYFEVMHAADIIVTSYTLLDRDADIYRKLSLGAVVLDEASAIRNPDTLAAKAARKMQAATRVAITGTPVENSVRDLWSIFQFLMPGYLGGREDFRRRYELPCAAESLDQTSRAAMQRLRWRTAPFMLRRTKSLVAKDLPPKIESIVWCDPSAMQADHYRSILRHGVEKIDHLQKSSGKESARMQMLTVLLRLRQSCCDLRLLDEELKDKPLHEVSTKLARLMELLSEAERGGHRVLVFSQFTSMLRLIRDELEAEGIGFSYLDGATRDRSAVVADFQKPDGPPVFLISLKAGGYGLTLTAADTVVLFDPWWNPAVEAQAADRIHRIGQTRPATIYKLITRGTVEEKILRLQDKKKSLTAATMGETDDDARPLMTGLSESEMLDLLEG